MHLSTAFGSLKHESLIDKLKCYGLKLNTLDFLGVISKSFSSKKEDNNTLCAYN